MLRKTCLLLLVLVLIPRFSYGQSSTNSSDSNSADAYNNRVVSWYEKGDYERAIWNYNKANEKKSIALNEKKSIALLEFETKGDVSKAIAKGITLIFQSQLVNTGQFAVFEKGKIDDILKKDGDIIKSWEEIVKEVTERSGGNINLFAQRIMITGSIYKINEKYFINVEIVDVGDAGRIIDIISTEIKSFTENDIKAIAKEIIDKLMIIEKVDSSEKKHSLSIFEFEGAGVSNVETSIITDRFRSYLVNTGEFNVLERGKPLEIGLLLPVDRIITGSIYKISEKYFINARMIDVKTGKILVETFEEFKSLNDNDIKTTTKKVLDRLNLKNI